MKRLSLFNHEKRINQLEKRDYNAIKRLEGRSDHMMWIYVALIFYGFAILGLGYVIKFHSFP